MKKNNGDKTKKKTNHDHNVETPTPPQVMDPSVLPVKQEEGKNKKKDKDKSGKENPAEKKKTPEQAKLAPAEEL